MTLFNPHNNLQDRHLHFTDEETKVERLHNLRLHSHYMCWDSNPDLIWIRGHKIPE